jgi:hypothetical protein
MVKIIKSYNRLGMFFLFWGSVIWIIKTLSYLIIDIIGKKPNEDILLYLNTTINIIMYIGIILIFIGMYQAYKVIIEMMEETDDEFNKIDE